MIDGSEVIGMALTDFGSVGTVNGSALKVIACLDGDMRLDGDELVRVGPYALASAADVGALSIDAGNNGDVLTLGGIAYTIVAIDPDGSGMVMLSLEEA